MGLEHLALDLEAVAKQDHDQRDGGQIGDEPAAGVEAAARPKPPRPSTNPVTTNTAVSDTKLRPATPETSAPATSTTPEHEHRGLEVTGHRARGARQQA